MPSHESDLELLQTVLDNTFGGDEEVFVANLDKLDQAKRRLEERGFSNFQEIGNRCLGLYASKQAMDACEANPDLQGVIISGCDVYFRPTAAIRVVGSVLRGCVGGPTVIDDDSEITSSDITHSTIIGSKIDSSAVINVKVVSSRLLRSHLFGIGQIYEANLTDCASSSSIAVRGVTAQNQRYGLGNLFEGAPNNGHAARMLANRGIIISGMGDSTEAAGL